MSAHTKAVEAALAKMTPIEGWFSLAEGAHLYKTAFDALSSNGDTPYIVEIGSYKGRSTIVLASAARDSRCGATIYAIDPHEGELVVGKYLPATFDAFQRNINDAGVASWVHPIVERARDVSWTTPIALLFIDGLHNYESVLGDFKQFSPWVVPGGYCAFHDYGPRDPGVVRAVDEILATCQTEWRADSQAETLRVLRRC